MKSIEEIDLAGVLSNLPNIAPLDCKKEFSKKEYDVFLCALGFEDRCLTLPEQLTEIKGFNCKQAIYFEYSTNIEDNETNKIRLIKALEKFSDSLLSFQCDLEDLTEELRKFFNHIAKLQRATKIIFDISVCSSKLLLQVMKVLFEYNICLYIVYSEAAIYHPTCEEFQKKPEKWTTEEGFGIARGVGKVIPSPEYSVSPKDNPNLIIAFPTFKPERTKAIIADIDETLLIRFYDRIIWIVGDPHMDEATKKKRKAIIREINGISEEMTSYDASTLDYKKTLEILDQIYKSKNLNFHLNISSLGSKMQSLGISLFCYIRPEISVYHALPKEYNPKQYSEGCKATWGIDFGHFSDVKCILDKVGQLEIISG